MSVDYNYKEEVDMKENEHLDEVMEKINEKKKRLDTLVLEGLGKDGLLDLSCELDELINEYYRLVLDKNSQKI